MNHGGGDAAMQCNVGVGQGRISVLCILRRAIETSLESAAEELENHQVRTGGDRVASFSLCMTTGSIQPGLVCPECGDSMLVLCRVRTWKREIDCRAWTSVEWAYIPLEMEVPLASSALTS